MLGQTKHSWGVFMKRLLAACAAFAALGACTTYGTGVNPGTQTVKDLTGMFALGGGGKSKKESARHGFT